MSLSCLSHVKRTDDNNRPPVPPPFINIMTNTSSENESNLAIRELSDSNGRCTSSVEHTKFTCLQRRQGYKSQFGPPRPQGVQMPKNRPQSLYPRWEMDGNDYEGRL